MELKELVTELIAELAKVSNTDAVVGKVQQAGKAQILPLSRISIGFGAALGEVGGKARREESRSSDADAAAGGAGGAVVVEPRAFVVVGEDGVPHLLALQRGKGAVVRRGVEILTGSNGTPELESAEPRRIGPGDRTDS